MPRSHLLISRLCLVLAAAAAASAVSAPAHDISLCYDDLGTFFEDLAGSSGPTNAAAAQPMLQPTLQPTPPAEQRRSSGRPADPAWPSQGFLLPAPPAAAANVLDNTARPSKRPRLGEPAQGNLCAKAAAAEAEDDHDRYADADDCFAEGEDEDEDLFGEGCAQLRSCAAKPPVSDSGTVTASDALPRTDASEWKGSGWQSRSSGRPAAQPGGSVRSSKWQTPAPPRRAPCAALSAAAEPPRAPAAAFRPPALAASSGAVASCSRSPLVPRLLLRFPSHDERRPTQRLAVIPDSFPGGLGHYRAAMCAAVLEELQAAVASDAARLHGWLRQQGAAPPAELFRRGRSSGWSLYVSATLTFTSTQQTLQQQWNRAAGGAAEDAAEPTLQAFLCLDSAERENSSKYAKGDLWALSSTPAFAGPKPGVPGDRTRMPWTVMAVSTFHGPTQDGRLALRLLGDRPAAARETRVFALRLAGAKAPLPLACWPVGGGGVCAASAATGLWRPPRQGGGPAGKCAAP